MARAEGHPGCVCDACRTPSREYLLSGLKPRRERCRGAISIYVRGPRTRQGTLKPLGTV